MSGRRPVLAVLGMHRSGTSAITRGLAALGVGLGDNLMAGIPGNNEKGFWEDNDIYRLSEDVLARLGSAWDRLEALDAAAMQGPQLSAERRRAAAILAERTEKSPVFAFKDPRTAILLPFWDVVFDDLGLSPRFVIALRNPLEVAQSLTRRDGFDEVKGLLLWAKHMLAALDATKSRPRVVVSFETMLEDPARELTRMAALVGAPAPSKDSAAYQAFAGEFLESSLRHNVASEAEILRAPTMPEPARRLYALLAAMAKAPAEKAGDADEAALAEVRAALSAFGPLLGYADRMETRVAAVSGMTPRIAVLENDLLTKENFLAEARGKIEILEKSAADWRNHAQNLEERVRRHANEIDRRDARIAEGQRTADAAIREAARLRREVEEKDRAVAVWSLHARQLEIAVEEERRRIAAMRRSLSWRLSAPVRFAGEFARNPVRAARTAVAFIARFFWRLLPVSPEQKGAIRDRLFAAAPALFSWSASYRAWRAAKETPARGSPTVATPDEAAAAVRAALHSEDVFRPLTVEPAPAETRVRAIAFYLPQFHPIPENDEWWGKGFTEWTNVSKAAPQFEGHYQPKLPGELGFYDLRVPEVQKRQVELAKLYGVHGFCFHFYWFTGRKRLLERPLNQYLADRSLDLPFMLCWANENWSRRWDGSEHEILMEQKHAPEDDLEFIEDVAPILKDPRYIRVGGRPALIVYRAGILPDPRRTLGVWRDYCRRNGVGEIHLIAALTFGLTDPVALGFDAAVEFPPHNIHRRPLTDAVKLLNPDYQGEVLDYGVYKESLRWFEWPDFPFYKTVASGWDNEARKPGRGVTYLGGEPAGYRALLDEVVTLTEARYENDDERLVFINAWNEWAEGAYLEPDRRYGYAYLHETREAIARRGEKAVILVHDLLRHGAQFLALNMARVMKERYGVDVAIVALGDGPLENEFRRYGRVFRADRANARAVADDLAAKGFTSAVVNSAATGWAATAFAAAGMQLVGLVHELPRVVAEMGLEPGLKAMDEFCEAVVFPAPIVRDRTGEAAKIKWRNPRIMPQGLFKRDCASGPAERAAAKARLCARLGFPDGATILLGVGHGDRRKAPDIFTKWALALMNGRDDVHAVWLGGLEEDMRAAVDPALAAAGEKTQRIRYLPFTADTRDFYAGADLYALTSREDPFPSTALDALASATPVLTVAGTGGVADLAKQGCVIALADDGAARFAAEAGRLLDDPERRARMGEAGRDLIRAEFGFATYVGETLRLAGAAVPRVSVVVPNYNYARHLEQRLSTILNQALAPFEIVFLDDASTDDSLAVAERALSASDVSWRIVRNEKNSGDVFAQWRKGAELARGDLVWIAEADDFADPEFLRAAAAGFDDPKVVLSYTQSKQVNEKGETIAPDYLDYVADIGAERWKNGYVIDGPREAVEALSIKNAIPNVSAVIFRRDALLKTLDERRDEIRRYRVAGDWCVYVNLLREGRARFEPRALNAHRRHDESVTISRFGLKELAEIARMQAFVAREFGADAATAAKARAYLDGLVAHFRLAEKHTARDIAAACAGEAP